MHVTSFAQYVGGLLLKELIFIFGVQESILMRDMGCGQH
jgi:hypothetical protein